MPSSVGYSPRSVSLRRGTRAFLSSWSGDRPSANLETSPYCFSTSERSSSNRINARLSVKKGFSASRSMVGTSSSRTL